MPSDSKATWSDFIAGEAALVAHPTGSKQLMERSASVRTEADAIAALKLVGWHQVFDERFAAWADRLRVDGIEPPARGEGG